MTKTTGMGPSHYSHYYSVCDNRIELVKLKIIAMRNYYDEKIDNSANLS